MHRYNGHGRKKAAGEVSVKTIYIDVLFLINLIMNYLMLVATARFTGAQASRGRLFLGAALGAVYAVFMFFPNLSFLYTAAVKLIFGAAVVGVTFGKLRPARFLHLTIAFMAVSCAFAGVVVALEYLTDAAGGYFHMRNGVAYINVSFRLLLCAAGVAYGGAAVFMRRKGSRGLEETTCRKVRITLFEKTAEITALVDTGNRLKDPVTGRAVLVVQADRMAELMPEKVAHIVRRLYYLDAATVMERLSVYEEARYFRLIPCATVSEPCAMLLAVRPDSVEIEGRHVPRGMLIGLTAQEVSCDSSMQALIGVS